VSTAPSLGDAEARLLADAVRGRSVGNVSDATGGRHPRRIARFPLPPASRWMRARSDGSRRSTAHLRRDRARGQATSCGSRSPLQSRRLSQRDRASGSSR